MKKMLRYGIVFFSMFRSAPTLAEGDHLKESIKTLDEIHNFFVANKISHRPYGSVLKDERFNEVTSADTTSQLIIHGIARKEDGLIYQITSTIKATHYTVEGGVRKPETAKDHTRTQATICELHAHKSVAKVTGYCRNLANDRFDPTGWVQIIRDARVVDNQLVLKTGGGTLGECFEKSDGFYPCGGESVEVLSIVNNKIRSALTYKKYRIDPDTYEKIKLERDHSDPDVQEEF